MNNFVTDAINIKTYPLSENDKIVLMLSRDSGLIRGVAKGVKRPKSKLGARMDILVANKLLLKKGRNLDTICQAQALNTFSKIRSDFDKMTYSMYLGELVSVFYREDSNSEEIYDSLYLTLENISNAENKTKIMLAALKFQLVLMKILGYGIELENCIYCGSKIEENPIFSISNGGVFCEKCDRIIGRKIKIPTKIRDFLVEISNFGVGEKTKYDDVVNETVCETCFNLMKQYIELQSSVKIKTSDVITKTAV